MNKTASLSRETHKKLSELDKAYFLHPTTSPKYHAENGPKVIFTEGKGVFVKDTLGDTYLDGLSMLWNVNIGHGNNEVANAAQEQMKSLAYNSTFVGYSNEPAIRLAEKIVSLAPGDLCSVFYTSGGSEANDTAFKLARFYWELKEQPQKRKIIALNNAYHGVTIAAQTATSIPNFHSFAGSNITEVFHAKPHLTNCELGDRSNPDYENSIRHLIEQEGSDTIAAIIMEPIQGSGGVNIPPEGYLQAIRNLCDEFNVLFINDEVICGFGRTGKMFGVDHWNVVPDILCFAKGVTSGYSQLGGVLINKEIRNTIIQYEGILSHGFTYSGHATSCAVALKNIEIIERDKILENVVKMEQHFKKGLTFLQEKHSIVTKTRTIGLLTAFELYEDPETNRRFNLEVQAATRVANECFERRLIVRAIRVAEGENIIAIAPPLIINKEEIDKIISILDDSISAFERKYFQ